MSKAHLLLQKGKRRGLTPVRTTCALCMPYACRWYSDYCPSNGMLGAHQLHAGGMLGTPRAPLVPSLGFLFPPDGLPFPSVPMWFLLLAHISTFSLSQASVLALGLSHSALDSPFRTRTGSAPSSCCLARPWEACLASDAPQLSWRKGGQPKQKWL